MRTCLIDADIFAYKFAARAETRINWGGDEGVTVDPGDFEEAAEGLQEEVVRVGDRLHCDEIIVCFTEPDATKEWRKILYPRYKAHRDPSKKPGHLRALKDHLAKKFRTYLRPGLEADDCLGILATHPTLIPGQKVIVSIDKDLLQIPGWLFNPNKHTKPVLITPDQGAHMHMLQTLMGDATDGYPGCPGIGLKRAEAALLGLSPSWDHPGEMWPTVVKLFEARGLTAADALMQARISRICTHTEYDYHRKEVILWTPPSAAHAPLRSASATSTA